MAKVMFVITCSHFSEFQIRHIMTWILLLLLTMIHNSSCEDQCFNKPCVCCRTTNCNINSTCENGCTDGFWGDRCYYSCPVNCVNCEQNDPSTCGKCHDGYYNGFWHDGNSYGPWTDNCINKCNPQCKSCYYYQHCKECNDGYYKTRTVENCTLPCPQRCVSCISEIDCTECKPGYFGRNCSELCSPGCDSPSCEKKTGRCNCTSNYMGDTCRYCQHNKYGIDCDLDCPEKCFVCNQSESCLFCKRGYEGPQCTQPITTKAQKQTARTTQAPKQQKDNHSLGTAIGSTFGVLSVILIILAIMFAWRKRQNGRNERRKRETSMSRSPVIRKLSGNIDMEMSVYDEIPGWSAVNDGYAVPNDLDGINSQSSYENGSEYSAEVDTNDPSKITSNEDSEHNDESPKADDRSSNYSFAIDPSNENEKYVEGNSKDITKKVEHDSEKEESAKVNPNIEKENSAKDNTAFQKEGSGIHNQNGCEEDIKSTKGNLNFDEGDAKSEKKPRKRRKPKGLKNLKNGEDYEKLHTGNEDEHIYAQDSAKLKKSTEAEKTVPDTPGYEKPISFKEKPSFEQDGTSKNDTIYEKAKCDKFNISFEKEAIEEDKLGCDKVANVDDNERFETEKTGKSLQTGDDYEELQKVQNNEHEYEDGVIELPDYTNVDNQAQSRSAIGVFTLGKF